MSRQHAPNLDDMYLFKMVAEHDSLLVASRNLRMPKSTLARRISLLEQQLGMPLFHKSGRKLLLTSFGSECLEGCRRLAREADAIIAMAERHRAVPDGFLHVIFPPLLGEKVIDELVTQFAADIPGIRIHVDTGITVLDPRSQSADMIIFVAFEDLPDINVVAKKIVQVPYALVAHPGIFDASYLPRTPQDLECWPCLALGSKKARAHWNLHSETEVFSLRFTPRLSTTHLPMLRKAALDGLGIAALPAIACAADLQMGKLVRVLPEWQATPGTIYAIYPSSRALTAAARQLLDIFVERIGEHIRSLDF